MLKKTDNAVSPVIGVMLMLVVTIIIAAVVSGFAGSLANTNSAKAPSLTMDVKVINTGSWSGSGFYASVTGASETINTKDLKIVTQWRSKSGTTGGNTTTGGVVNSYTKSVAPFGYGSGVNSSISSSANGPQWSQNPTSPYNTADQQFGNYTLIPGTQMSAWPYGGSNKELGNGIGGSTGYGVLDQSNLFTYVSYNGTDPTKAVLGTGWEALRAGDTVSVSVVHIPSGKTIFQRDVAVGEA